MTFDDLERQAMQTEKGKTSDGLAEITPLDRLCLFGLTELYCKYQRGEIGKKNAQLAKLEIKADFELLKRERRLWAGALAQYQENIRLASEQWSSIAVFARTATDAELIDRLLAIITAMVGEAVTAQAVRKARLRTEIEVEGG